MAYCPLCSDVLLRHIRSGQTYWLCRRCRLEILENVHQIHRQSLVNTNVVAGSLPTASHRQSISTLNHLLSQTTVQS